MFTINRTVKKSGRFFWVFFVNPDNGKEVKFFNTKQTDAAAAKQIMQQNSAQLDYWKGSTSVSYQLSNHKVINV